jgi:hypothetical protein
MELQKGQCDVSAEQQATFQTQDANGYNFASTF